MIRKRLAFLIRALVEAVRAGEPVASRLFEDYLPAICDESDLAGPATDNAREQVSSLLLLGVSCTCVLFWRFGDFGAREVAGTDLATAE